MTDIMSNLKPVVDAVSVVEQGTPATVVGPELWNDTVNTLLRGWINERPFNQTMYGYIYDLYSLYSENPRTLTALYTSLRDNL